MNNPVETLFCVCPEMMKTCWCIRPVPISDVPKELEDAIANSGDYYLPCAECSIGKHYTTKRTYEEIVELIEQEIAHKVKLLKMVEDYDRGKYHD